MEPPQYVAFAGTSCIGRGSLPQVASAAKHHEQSGDRTGPSILVLDAGTSEPVEIDLRGTLDEVLARVAAPTGAPAQPRTPGRPKLGVVAREVTLLPRHWEWLAEQPGSASVTLRKLVEQARREDSATGRVRHAQEAAYRFMLAVAGNEPGFEEALRALYAGDAERFSEFTATWPADVADHARELAARAFSAGGA